MNYTLRMALLSALGTVFALFSFTLSAEPKYYTFEGSVSGFADDANIENNTISVGANVAYTVLIDSENPGTVEGPGGSSTTGHYYAKFVSGSLLAPADIEPTVDLSNATRSYYGIHNSGANNGFIDNITALAGSEYHLIEIYGMADIASFVPGTQVNLFERLKKQGSTKQLRYQASLTLTEISSSSTPNPQEVGVDIKPGSFPNSINLSSGGVTPVALLGSADLDVNDVDWGSLTLGTAGIKTVGKHDKQLCYTSDESGDFLVDPAGAPDGFTDLICHFTTISIVPEEGGTTVTLNGALINGDPIEGVDLVNIVP